MKASFQSITPLIPAGSSLAEALAFYTEHMGFSVAWQNDQMACIERDSMAFNLIVNDNPVWAENSSFSIGVSDLEALGFLARVVTELAARKISVNAVSAYHHDYLFIPTRHADRITF